MGAVGLDGFVRCRCWQDGRVTPPAALAGLIVFADGDLDLSVPWEGNADLHNALTDWVYDSPCPHEDMDFVCEHVGNWTGYRGFQRTLGQEYFPVLRSTLPESNGGTSPASLAAAALAELRSYAEHAVLDPLAVLCDADTGEVLLEQIHSFGGLNVIGSVSYGVSLSGFFVVCEDTEVFRSMSFDAADVPGRPFGDASRRLEVRSRPEDADVYSFAVVALTRLFEGSVATGNPVVWC